MANMTFQQGVGGYAGSSDTMLRQSKPTTSFGNAASINVDGADSAGKLNQGVLYFGDIFGSGLGQIPQNAVITSATLTLNVTDGTSQPFSLYRMLTGWTEGSTWNSIGNGIQTDGIEAATTADVTVASIAAGTRSINVTQSVDAWAHGAANFGWAFLMTGSNGWDFTSTEGTIAPTLSVVYEVATPGLLVTQSGGSTSVTEGGQGDSVAIALQTAPSTNVTVTLGFGNDIAASPQSLTFTPGNWNTAQTVAVSAVDDLEREPTEVKSLTLSAASSDSSYNGKTATVDVTIADNDSPPPVHLSVVRITDTTAAQYKVEDPFGICDPSGIACVPGLGLLIADSEHDESPFFSQNNLFEAGLNGDYIDALSLRSFTREPTGLAYNPTNGFLYISDDDADAIYWVNPANPGVKLGQFGVKGYGITDCEDPEFDPGSGHLYVLDGVTTRMFELTVTGALVRVIDLPAAITDAEGLAYDAARDVFYLSSGKTNGTIFEMDPDGNLIDTFTLLNNDAYRNPAAGKPKLKGLELAPSSDPNDDSHHLSLYAVDYGADQKADGRLFEIDLGPDSLIA